jgi:hypothetical protein
VLNVVISLNNTALQQHDRYYESDITLINSILDFNHLECVKLKLDRINLIKIIGDKFIWEDMDNHSSVFVIRIFHCIVVVILNLGFRHKLDFTHFKLLFNIGSKFRFNTNFFNWTILKFCKLFLLTS